MKLITYILILMTLVACGSNNTKENVVAVKVGNDLYKTDRSATIALNSDNNERIVCEKRIVSGTHRKVKVCTTAAEKQREREAAEDQIRRNINQISRESLRNFGGG